MLDRRTLLACIPAATALSVLPSTAQAITEPASLGFRHSLLFGLKSDVTAPQREELVGAIKGLAKIPGVKELMIHKVNPSNNPEVDSTGGFQYALAVDFASQADYQAYQAHDLYKSTMRDKFTPYRGLMTTVDVDKPFWFVSKDPKLASAEVKLRHFVLFNFKPSVPEPIRYHVNATIMGATATQPTVLGFMMGKNIIPSSATSRFEWLCVADFASVADSDAYQNYPLHTDVTRDIFEPNYSECIVDDVYL